MSDFNRSIPLTLTFPEIMLIAEQAGAFVSGVNIDYGRSSELERKLYQDTINDLRLSLFRDALPIWNTEQEVTICYLNYSELKSGLGKLSCTKENYGLLFKFTNAFYAAQRDSETAHSPLTDAPELVREILEQYSN